MTNQNEAWRKFCMSERFFGPRGSTPFHFVTLRSRALGKLVNFSTNIATPIATPTRHCVTSLFVSKAKVLASDCVRPDDQYTASRLWRVDNVALTTRPSHIAEAATVTT